MASHPDLEAEQAHIDRAYERLEAMRAHAREMLESALSQGRGSTPQAREEREVLVNSSLHRLSQLDIGDRSLCFGRIDRAPSGPEDAGAGETFYVGRLGVYGEDQEPLAVDWRAPVAEPFYRATGRDPMGLTRRRHFSSDGRKLLDIEDELFGLPGRRSGDGAATQGAAVAGELEGTFHEASEVHAGDTGADDAEASLSGSGMLLAALERSRSGHMRDIVATVQREQDEIIRAALPGVLLVQGGPGTGKTAVALHRAAYLLYTYRFPLERQGVLVIGPNQVFLRYIERVLPSLGESGVVLSTIQGLVRDARVRSVETKDTALLKGDARMARVIAKAVRDRERPLNRALEVPFGSTVLRMTKQQSRTVVRSALRRSGTHNSKRPYVESFVARLLYSQYVSGARRASDAAAARSASADGEVTSGALAGTLDRDIDRDEELGSSYILDEEEFLKEIRRAAPVVEALDRMWPRLLPEELLHDLYGSLPLLALAGRDVLMEEEARMLHRERSSSIEEIPWTEADLPLLDEARVLLGPVRGPADDALPRSYGHIVVDEAQDLSPMELRMLARRCLSGSMTVVGDIAQATGPRAPDSWDEVTEHLPSARPPRLTELSVNYRTPAEVMEMAGKILEVAAPGLSLPRSVRSTGEHPQVREVEAARLAPAVAELAAEELVSVGDGTVAVVATDPTVQSLGHALREAGLEAASAAEKGIGSPLTLVPIGLVKGLEFDSVIVVEPALLVEEAGLRALFVAMSRPTKRLMIVHSQPLPVDLPG